MNTRKVILLWLALMLAVSTMAPAEEFEGSSWFGLKIGPYKVGYRLVLTEDPGRGFRHITDFRGNKTNGPHTRPLAISIWYPADKSADGTSLSLYDYSEIAAREYEYDLNEKNASEPLKAFLAHEGINIDNAEDIAKMKQLSGYALRDAPGAKGRFPIFLYAPSYDAPAVENSQLCEYLASHGFLVLSAPSVGPSDRSMTLNAAGIEVQVQDLQFLLRYAATMENADISKISVGGFSWGGLASALLAMRDPRIRAVASLDGSLSERIASQFGDYPFLDSRAIRAPLYAMSSAGFSDLIEKFLYCDRLTVVYKDIGHEHFSGFWNSSVYEHEDPEHIHAVYRDICTSVHAFLKAALSGNIAMEKFRAHRNAFAAKSPAKIVTQAALPAPPSDMEFLTVMEKEGLEAARSLYKACKERDPEVRIASQMDVEAFGRSQPFEKRVAVLAFVKEAFGENSSYFNNMGAAYISAGDDANAEKWFRKALEANPRSGYAKRSLAAIEERKKTSSKQ